MSATDQVKDGTHIDVGDAIFRIVECQHGTPGKGPAFVRTELKRSSDGNVIDKPSRAGEKFRPVCTEARKMQFFHTGGADAHVMDGETSERFPVPERTLREQLERGLPSEELDAVSVDDDAAEIKVRAAVEMAVAETEPGLRGDTASRGGHKQATQSGVVVRPPVFVNVGERGRMDARGGAYVSRA